MMKYSILFFFIVIQLFFACTKKIEPQDIKEDKAIIVVQNKLNVDIDSFLLYVNTIEGKDSTLWLNIKGKEESTEAFFDSLKYNYLDNNELFLFKNARVVIEETNYYLTNCLCDPGLMEGILSEGKYAIVIEEIDELRSSLEYAVVEID